MTTKQGDDVEIPVLRLEDIAKIEAAAMACHVGGETFKENADRSHALEALTGSDVIVALCRLAAQAKRSLQTDRIRRSNLDAALVEEAEALRVVGPSDTSRPTAYIDVVFDGPPGPQSGRFVEVEDDQQRGRGVGKWIDDGAFWRLRLNVAHQGVHTTDLGRMLRDSKFAQELDQFGIVDLRDTTDEQLMNRVIDRLREADDIEQKLGLLRGSLSKYGENVEDATKAITANAREEWAHERGTLTAKLQLVREALGAAEGEDVVEVARRIRSAPDGWIEEMAELMAKNKKLESGVQTFDIAFKYPPGQNPSRFVESLRVPAAETVTPDLDPAAVSLADVVVLPLRQPGAISDLQSGSAHDALAGRKPLTYPGLMDVLSERKDWGPGDLHRMTFALGLFVADLRDVVTNLAIGMAGSPATWNEEPSVVGDARLPVGPGAFISVPLERWREAWGPAFGVVPGGSVPLDLDGCLAMVRDRVAEIEEQRDDFSTQLDEARKERDDARRSSADYASQVSDAMAILGADPTESLKQAAERVEVNCAERARERDAASHLLAERTRERDGHRATLNRIADRLHVVHEDPKIEVAVTIALAGERDAVEWRNALASVADQVGVNTVDNITTPKRLRDAVSQRILDLQRLQERPLAKLSSVEDIDWDEAENAIERMTGLFVAHPTDAAPLVKHEEHRRLVAGELQDIGAALRIPVNFHDRWGANAGAGKDPTTGVLHPVATSDLGGGWTETLLQAVSDSDKKLDSGLRPLRPNMGATSMPSVGMPGPGVDGTAWTTGFTTVGGTTIGGGGQGGVVHVGKLYTSPAEQPLRDIIDTVAADPVLGGVVLEIKRSPARIEGGPVPCTWGTPETRALASGHWRDWHRGHGCTADPDAKAGIAIPPRTELHAFPRDQSLTGVGQAVAYVELGQLWVLTLPDEREGWAGRVYEPWVRVLGGTRLSDCSRYRLADRVRWALGQKP